MPVDAVNEPLASDRRRSEGFRTVAALVSPENRREWFYEFFGMMSCMTLHEETFNKNTLMNRGPSYEDATLDEVIRWDRAFDLMDNRGILGGFLFHAPPGLTSEGGGDLVAILHRRRGKPEWTRVVSDFREAWRLLPAEIQEQCLQFELSSSSEEDDGLGPVVPSRLASDLSRHPAPNRTSFTTVETFPIPEKPGRRGPRMDEDQLAFLWVLNQYRKVHGKLPRSA